MNLFDFTHGSTAAPGPREATKEEMRAYLEWLATVRRVAVPCDAQYTPSGILNADGAPVLAMPGYGPAEPVTCELLDDAGAVVRTISLPIDRKSKVAFTPAQAKEWSGLANVRKPRAKKAAAEPAQAVSVPVAISAPIAAAPAPVAAPTPVDAAAVLDALAHEVPAPSDAIELRVEAAAVITRAAVEAEPVRSATVQGANDLWMAFVANVANVAPNGWTIAAGKQRDRKARNRGLMVISGPDIEAMRVRFEAIMGGPREAVGLPVVEACPAPAPEPVAAAVPDVLADTIAMLGARIAVLEAHAIGAKPPRSPRHAAAIRRAWSMRREMRERADLDRRALLKVNGDNRLLLETLQRVEAERDASRADRERVHDSAVALAQLLQDAQQETSEARQQTIAVRVELREAQAAADMARDEVTAAGMALDRLRAAAVADRAQLDRLAPLIAALGAIAPPAAVPVA